MDFASLAFFFSRRHSHILVPLVSVQCAYYREVLQHFACVVMTICPSFDIYLHTMHQSITLYASNGLIARLRSMYAPSPLSTTEIILLSCLPSYTTQSHSTSTQHIWNARGSQCENLKWPFQLPITKITTVWSKRFKLKRTCAGIILETVCSHCFVSKDLKNMNVNGNILILRHDFWCLIFLTGCAI